MSEIGDSDRTADPAHRRERGIEAYARIFGVPEKDVPAAMADRCGAAEVALLGDRDEVAKRAQVHHQQRTGGGVHRYERRLGSC